MKEKKINFGDVLDEFHNLCGIFEKRIQGLGDIQKGEYSDRTFTAATSDMGISIAFITGSNPICEKRQPISENDRIEFNIHPKKVPSKKYKMSYYPTTSSKDHINWECADGSMIESFDLSGIWLSKIISEK